MTVTDDSLSDTASGSDAFTFTRHLFQGVRISKRLPDKASQAHIRKEKKLQLQHGRFKESLSQTSTHSKTEAVIFISRRMSGKIFRSKIRFKNMFDFIFR